MPEPEQPVSAEEAEALPTTTYDPRYSGNDETVVRGANKTPGTGPLDKTHLEQARQAVQDAFNKEPISPPTPDLPPPAPS